MTESMERDGPPGVVPIVDAHKGGRIYHPRLLRFALVGGAIGLVLLGWISASVESGFMPVPGLGQFSAAGTAVAVVAGGGIGLAVGALAGALIVLYRLPKRKIEQD